MLYSPAVKKPELGQAGIITDHPLTPDFFLAFNEGGGNEVRDLISEKAFTFYSSGLPTWEADGLNFNADYESIEVPDFNSIIPAGAPEGTVFFGRTKNTITPASYNYAFTVGAGYQIFSFLWGAGGTSLQVYVGSSGLTYTVPNLNTAKTLAFTWIQNGATLYGYLYADGAYVGYNTLTITILESSETLYIGGRTGGTGRFYGSIMPFFYIKLRALTGYEIAGLSANPYQWMYDEKESYLRSVWAVAQTSAYADLSFLCGAESEADTILSRTAGMTLECESEAGVLMDFDAESGTSSSLLIEAGFQESAIFDNKLTNGIMFDSELE